MTVGSWPSGALPVGRLAVRLREPTGADQLLLIGPDDAALDTMAAPVEAMLALVERIVVDPGGGNIPWLTLPAVDLAAAALMIRRGWLGDRVAAETICPRPGCREPIDVAFRLSDYLEHHRPRRFRGLQDAGGGWMTLTGGDVSFRIPTIGDAFTATRERHSTMWMFAQCIRPSDPPAAVRRRVDRALNAIAPRLEDYVAGQCPACRGSVEMFFDPVSYVWAELRDASAELDTEVHELAMAYHWSEASIMGLDRRRRHAYATMVRGEHALT